LPFTTQSVSPAFATAVGYQPTGILPDRRSLPDARATFDAVRDRSNIATAFASASATYNRVPSAESDMAFGVLPSPGPAGGGSLSRATTSRVRVSITKTRSVLPDATNKREPSALSSSADGWR